MSRVAYSAAVGLMLSALPAKAGEIVVNVSTMKHTAPATDPATRRCGDRFHAPLMTSASIRRVAMTASGTATAISLHPSM